MSALSFTDKITGQECTIGTGNLVDDLIASLRRFGLTDLPSTGTTNVADIERLGRITFSFLRERYANTPFVQELFSSGQQALSERTISALDRAAGNGVKGMLIVAYGNIPQHTARTDGGYIVIPDNGNDEIERIPRVCTDAGLEVGASPLLVAGVVGILVYLATK